MPDYVIIPAGGLGLRFKNQRFSKPKPFIKVLGKTQIHWTVTAAVLNYPNSRILLAHRSGLSLRFKWFKFKSRTCGLKISLIDVGSATLGAAHTVALALEELLAAQKKDFSFVSVDNDVAVIIDESFLSTTDDVGLAVTFSTNSQHSFVSIDGDHNVIEIAEKQVISEDGIVGNYYFKSARLFSDYFSEMSVSKEEIYISKIVSLYLRDARKVTASRCLKVLSFGTPDEILHLKSADFDFLRITNE
jgi:NDP-sugar pyrophosphorylase family protein